MAEDELDEHEARALAELDDLDDDPDDDLDDIALIGEDIDDLDAYDRSDAEDEDSGPRHTALSRGVESWRSRTASGAIMSAVAMGLANVFAPEHKKPAIIAEAPGDPYDDDDPVQVDYVADDAEATRVRVRPWLFDQDQDEAG